MRRLLDGLYTLSGWLAGCFLIAIFAIMMFLSVGRELGINAKSGDDIAAWCMAAMGFLGLAHTFRKGELIRMGLVIENQRGIVRRLMELLTLLLALALTGYFAWHATKLTYESWLLNDLSTGVLIIPLWIPQLGFSAGLVILAIAILDELVHVARGGEPHYAKPPPKTREEVIERATTGNL